MTFRISTSHMVHRALAASRRHLDRIGQAQLQTISGLRINRPSDDPLATRSILTHRALDQRLEADKQNIEQSRTLLNVSVTRILDIKNLLVEGKSIALESPQTVDRRLLAEQVDLLLERANELANSSFDGHYLFSGTAVYTKPFGEFPGANGSTTYQGASQRTETVIGIDLVIDVLYRGDEVFQPTDRQTTVFAGTTGATAGLGTDSAVGRGTLTVRHVATQFAAGSGVLIGDDSPQGDTIIGAAGTHVLSITDTVGDGSAGTVSLNGGPPVTFSSADTNLRVTGRHGEIIYLNTTSITPGFDGSIDVTASGTLSVDNGLTETPIDFSDNQTIAHSVTGHVTNVDSQNILQTGTESLSYVGTVDVFQVLQNLSEDLQQGADLPDAEWQESISRAIGDFDRLINHVVSVVGEQSTTLQSLDGIQARYERTQLESRGIVGELEAADIAQTVVDLQSEQNLLQFTYATTSTLFELNFLDFI